MSPTIGGMIQTYDKVAPKTVFWIWSWLWYFVSWLKGKPRGKKGSKYHKMHLYPSLFIHQCFSGTSASVVLPEEGL